MASLDSEIAKTQEEKRVPEQQLTSLTLVTYDKDLCGGSIRFKDYEQSIPVNNEEENVDAMDSEVARKLASYTAPKSTLKDMPRGTGCISKLGWCQEQMRIFWRLFSECASLTGVLCFCR